MPAVPSPDYGLHEQRYRERRRHTDVYAGWFTERDYEQGIEEFKRLMALGIAPAHGDLLDVGCGAGNYAFRLAALGYTVTGVDISPTAIDWARESAVGMTGGPEFVCGDGVSLADFEDASFDFIFDGHFLHCILGQDRTRFLGNVYRVLKPGGFFMVRSLVWPVTNGGGLEIDPKTRVGFYEGIPYRYYAEAEELVSEVASAGFDVRDWRYTLKLSDGHGFQHVVLQCIRFA